MFASPKIRLRGKRRNGESGAAALEFALLSPVLFAFLFGTYELGWAIHCGASVRFAVERAARLLLANPSTTAQQIQNSAQAQLSGIPVSNLQVSLSTEAASTGQITRVSWSYSYAMALPYVPNAVFHFDSSTVVPMPSI